MMSEDESSTPKNGSKGQNTKTKMKEKVVSLLKKIEEQDQVINSLQE